MNRQVFKTEKVIYEALLKKMETKSYPNISVVEIVDEADISRLSFYRHFSTKEDIIFSKFKEIIDSILEKINSDFSHNPKYLIMVTLETIDNYAKLFRAVVKNNLDGLIVQSFNRDIGIIIRKLFGIDNEDVYVQKFYEGAFIHLLIEWIRNENKITMESFSDILFSLFHPQQLSPI